MTILAGLLPDVFEDFGADLDVLEVPNEITKLTAGEWMTTRELFNGQPFNVRTRFTNIRLSSVAFRTTVTDRHPDGRPDANATIVAYREMSIQVGDKWLTIDEFVEQIVRHSTANATTLSIETIMQILKQYGFDPHGECPMYLQHLGANKDAFSQLAEDFVGRGAADNTADVRRRSRGKSSTVQASFRHPSGIPVHSLEVSRANRDMSMTSTGFIGFGDAMFNTLVQVLSLHRQRIALNAIVNDSLASDEAKAAAAGAEAQIRSLFTVAQQARAFHNWGGTTKITDVLNPDAVAIYYAQQVPCGRFTLDDGTVYSVWGSSATNAANASVAAAAEAVAPPPLQATVAPF